MPAVPDTGREGFCYSGPMHAAAHTPLVQDARTLARLCDSLRGAPWLALDTEFLREKTYYPRLCLVQVATPERLACIDPLAIEDLGPLFELLRDPGTVKVLHAARQDLEALLRVAGEVPAPVFDTQLAAGLLGLPEQVGYGTLVERLLGVSLAKAHTRADWSRRPLPPEWVDYAADDVRYLARVYELMLQRLADRGRLGWLDPEFQALVNPALYQPDPEQAWLRVARSERLNDHQRAVLQALAAWRERTAQSQDRPRLWILRDEVLVDIARTLPRTREALAGLRDFPERTLERHGRVLLELVAEHRERRLAAPRAGASALGPREEALADLLAAVVRLRASELDIHPTLLANRRELERLAAGEHGLAVNQGWRHLVVGATLEGLMAGQVHLRVVEGRAELVDGPEPS